MSEFEHTFVVQLLPLGCKSPSFQRHPLRLDPMRDSSATIKDKLNVRGITIFNAAIVADNELVRNWFEEGQGPVIVVQCPALFEESDEWAKNPNQLARLMNGGVPIDCALVALGRVYWREGFEQFSTAASALRQLVDKAHSHEYQLRMEVACLSHPQRELLPVAVFNEFTGQVQFPPLLRGEIRGSPYVGEWVEKPVVAMSQEERASVAARAARLRDLQEPLNVAAKSVVRVFGYHVTSHDLSASPLASPTAAARGGELGGGGFGSFSVEEGSVGSASAAHSPTHGSPQRQQTNVVPFSAFFVSPRHLLTTRTAKYSEAHKTFAHRYAFTRRVRAMHAMLTPGEDLFECREVDEVRNFLRDSIRRIGINLEEAQVPPSYVACSWSDLMLLEVVDPAHYSDYYLLPEIPTPASPPRSGKRDSTSSGEGSAAATADDHGSEVAAPAEEREDTPVEVSEDGGSNGGGDLFCLQYTTRPDEGWIEEVFGYRGHNKLEAINEETLRTQFWHYDTTFVAMAMAKGVVTCATHVRFCRVPVGHPSSTK